MLKKLEISPWWMWNWCWLCNKLCRCKELEIYIPQDAASSILYLLTYSQMIFVWGWKTGGRSLPCSHWTLELCLPGVWQTTKMHMLETLGNYNIIYCILNYWSSFNSWTSKKHDTCETDNNSMDFTSTVWNYCNARGNLLAEVWALSTYNLVDFTHTSESHLMELWV